MAKFTSKIGGAATQYIPAGDYEVYKVLPRPHPNLLPSMGKRLQDIPLIEGANFPSPLRGEGQGGGGHLFPDDILAYAAVVVFGLFPLSLAGCSGDDSGSTIKREKVFREESY